MLEREEVFDFLPSSFRLVYRSPATLTTRRKKKSSRSPSRVRHHQSTQHILPSAHSMSLFFHFLLFYDLISSMMGRVEKEKSFRRSCSYICSARGRERKWLKWKSKWRGKYDEERKEGEKRSEKSSSLKITWENAHTTTMMMAMIFQMFCVR